MASCLRVNKSQEAEVDVGNLWGSGRFKLVYRGSYSSGLRQGTECVSKFFKTSRDLERAFFGAELKVIEEATKIVDQFNAVNVIDERISLNLPEIWRPDGSVVMAGKMCLVEPMITNFAKFNSNTGWTPLWKQDHQNFWIDAMQALSHFSFHCSGGATLLCDLQGGATEEGFTLTDPVIMSTVPGAFGPSDLGTPGISTFFYRHECNMFCNADWMVPIDVRTYFPCRRGSSMEMPGKPKEYHHSRPRRFYYNNPGSHFHSHNNTYNVSVLPGASLPGNSSVADNSSQVLGRLSPAGSSSGSGISYAEILQQRGYNPASQAWSPGSSLSIIGVPSSAASSTPLVPARLIKVRLAPYTAP